jgi:hypothetical protein
LPEAGEFLQYFLKALNMPAKECTTGPFKAKSITFLPMHSFLSDFYREKASAGKAYRYPAGTAKNLDIKKGIPNQHLPIKGSFA